MSEILISGGGITGTAAAGGAQKEANIYASTKPENALIFSSSSDRNISIQIKGQTGYISSDQYAKIKDAIQKNPDAYPDIDDVTRKAIVGMDQQGNPLSPIRGH